MLEQVLSRSKRFTSPTSPLGSCHRELSVRRAYCPLSPQKRTFVRALSMSAQADIGAALEPLVDIRLLRRASSTLGRKDGTADGVVAFGISNSAISLITRMIHTIRGVTADEEVTRHSNCVLEDDSLHRRLRF